MGGDTNLPLSDDELASLRATLLVRRPVHWTLAARLLAEVMRGRRAARPASAVPMAPTTLVAASPPSATRASDAPLDLAPAP